MAQTDVWDYGVFTPKIAGGNAGTTLALGVAAPVLTGTTYTLAAAEFSNTVLNFGGTPAAAVVVTAPLTEGTVFVAVNGTGQAVTIQGSSGAAVVVAAGKTALVWCDGTAWKRMTADV